MIEAQPLSLAQSARYLILVTEALAYCHQRGIIHRNLTPDSIYITLGGQVKLGDFDFARVPTIGQTITKTGQILVDTKYTAPEQLANPREVGPQADLYALGAVWYDMLFRRPEEEPIRLALIHRSDLPEEARHLLSVLLAPYPEDRPASMGELKSWFELFAEDM
jgi:serine/threonine protein kinase